MIDASVNFHNDTKVTSATTYMGDSVALRKVASLSQEAGGNPMEAVVQVTSSFNGGTSSDFRLATSNGPAMTGPVTQASTGAVATALLVTGYTAKFAVGITTADADASHLGVVAVTLGVHADDVPNSKLNSFSAWLQPSNTDQSTVNDVI